MSFYYPSIFSFIFLAVLYAVVLGLIWLVWVKLVKRKFSGPAAWGVMALVIVAPWLEEFWIAWNFGQFCRKDAGLVVHKVVEVEGFYDDTTHWWRQLAESKYQFVESRDNTYGGLYRVEKNGSEIRHYKIDRLTARYHYFRNIYGEDVSYKITRVEARITDSKNGEVIGKYVSYGRGPYWFYISLGKPPYSCDGPDGGPLSNGNSLIYRNTLLPIKK